MKKRSFKIVFTAIVLSTIFILASCGEAKVVKSVDNHVTVWSALSTEKYMLDKKVENKGAAKLDFVGIKNEIQSMQLMLTAKTKVSSFNLTTADLKGTKGGIIGKDKVSVFAERYVDIFNPYVEVAGYLSEAGFYPDALVPIDRYITTKENVITEGNNQGIWVDISIPRDIAADTYSGSFTLEVNGATKQIPVSLKVYDLEMPDEVHSRSAFEIWYETIAFGEGNNLDANTYQTYYETLHTKRLTSSQLPPEHTSSIEKFAEYIVELAQMPAVSTYRFPMKFHINKEVLVPLEIGTYPQSQIDAEILRLKNNLKAEIKVVMEKNFELRESGVEKYADLDLFRKAIYYFEDEPARGRRTQLVRTFCEQLNTAKKELLLEFKDMFDKYPELVESFDMIDEICPSNYIEDVLWVSSKNPADQPYEPDYDKSDGLTFWCPEMYKFDNEAFRNIVKQRQAYGETFWWYLCVSNTPHPSYYVESLPMNIRLQSWMQYDYGIEGILYWQMNHWNDVGDPYENVTYYEYGGGEGILYYPGVKYGLKTPVSSIRLEQIRLGQQDYELFWMLNNYLSEEEGNFTAQKVIAELGEKLYKGTTVLDNADERLFESCRIEVLEILENFAKGDTAKAMNLVNEIVK